MRCALVCGGAACVFEDIERVVELFRPDAVYAVNDIGAHLPLVNVWATLHPEFMDDWETDRKAQGLPDGYEIVAPLVGEVGDHGKKGHVSRRITYRWPGMNSSASSGIYGAKVAIEDGFKVVLAGIPMEAGAGHFLPDSIRAAKQGGRPRGTVWAERDSFLPGLKLALPFMTGRVKSMSGHTRELLGAPTLEWLKEI